MAWIAVSSRCLHYFPAAMLLYHRGTSTWLLHTGLCKYVQNYSPFPSSPKSLHQSEVWCTTIHMKMSIICKWMKFSYERMGTKTRFEEEVYRNSEMAYSTKIWGVGKRTDLKLGEVSSLSISDNITISWLNLFTVWAMNHKSKGKNEDP